MKNKKMLLVVMITVISIIIISGLLIAVNKNSKDNESSDKISKGYIAIFHGGVGEVTNETYIYKIDNGLANYGFKYVNTTSTTTSWGSDKWNTKITKQGSVNWIDNVFEVAKENDAYSFVTLPNSNKSFTIEEYRQMFTSD